MYITFMQNVENTLLFIQNVENALLFIQNVEICTLLFMQNVENTLFFIQDVENTLLFIQKLDNIQHTYIRYMYMYIHAAKLLDYGFYTLLINKYGYYNKYEYYDKYEYLVILYISTCVAKYIQ